MNWYVTDNEIGDGVVWDARASLLGSNLTLAVMNSSIPLDRLDDMVTRYELNLPRVLGAGLT